MLNWLLVLLFILVLLHVRLWTVVTDVTFVNVVVVVDDVVKLLNLLEFHFPPPEFLHRNGASSKSLKIRTLILPC